MKAKSGVSLSLLLLLLLPLLLLLLTPLIFFIWSKSAAPSFEIKQRAPRESVKITHEQFRLLARWMSVTGGGSGLNDFATKLTGPSTSTCSAAAFCQSDRGNKWRVRALLAKFNVSINNDDEYNLVEMKETHYDIAVTSSVKVVRHRSDGSAATWPTAYYMGDRLGDAYITSRVWPLGLQHCELVTDTNDFNLDAEIQSPWETPLQGLSNPGQFTEVRQHGYNRQRQLWIRSEVGGGQLTQALAVRVLNDATRDCSVERRWLLRRSEDGQRLLAVMEEFSDHAVVNSKDDMFRLPTACYRVDL